MVKETKDEVFDLECPSEEDEAFSWFAGFYQNWETLRSLQQRAIRSRSILLGVHRKVHEAEVVVGSLKCSALNAKLIRMFAERMAKHGVIRNPPLARLFGQFLSFHWENGLLSGEPLNAVAHADAWGLKRLLTCMRRTWSRGESPRESRLQLYR